MFSSSNPKTLRGSAHDRNRSSRDPPKPSARSCCTHPWIVHGDGDGVTDGEGETEGEGVNDELGVGDIDIEGLGVVVDDGVGEGFLAAGEVETDGTGLLVDAGLTVTPNIPVGEGDGATDDVPDGLAPTD